MSQKALPQLPSNCRPLSRPNLAPAPLILPRRYPDHRGNEQADYTKTQIRHLQATNKSLEAAIESKDQRIRALEQENDFLRTKMHNQERGLANAVKATCIAFEKYQHSLGPRGSVWNTQR